VIILGPCGRNFAAGMSGGVAYVLDEKGDFHSRCNRQMVELERFVDDAEVEEVRQMIQRHAEYTQSQRAWRVLALWDKYCGQFVKVMPRDYKRVLQELKKVEEQGLSGEEAIMAAFEANAQDVARIGGG
jgi:glutamate synthase (ferredoxin)